MILERLFKFFSLLVCGLIPVKLGWHKQSENNLNGKKRGYLIKRVIVGL